VFPLIPSPPSPTLFDLGPINNGWYGLGYIIGLGGQRWVTQREVARRGIEPSHVWNAFLIVFIAALVGGRLYHVIDQWAFYQNNLIQALIPISDRGIGFAGLGLYGGIAGAMIGIFIYTRWKHIPLRLGLDAIIPGTLFAQGIARWGNYFNQELYGPPTDAPWGIAIDCVNRVAQYPCDLFPAATTGFHPLFFYESSLDILGGLIALYLSRRYLSRLYPGDLAAFWLIWYGLIRGALEFLREGWNWTLGPLGGIPTAQIIGVTIAVIGVIWIAYNHRPGHPVYVYADPILPPAPPPDPFADEDEFADDDGMDAHEELASDDDLDSDHGPDDGDGLDPDVEGSDANDGHTVTRKT
jgi:phosphatidylglycerol:prolipoprotein diacylglycerol transferase